MTTRLNRLCNEVINIPYIHFTDEQKSQANGVDLTDFLTRQGEKLIPSGRDKRLARDHSVTIRGNQWYDHATGQGGGAVSFLQHFYDLSYPDAVSRLLGGEAGLSYAPAQQGEPEPKKEFVLPPANKDMRRVYAYLLKQRHIDREVITAFARANLIYEDSKYHNAVFVGKDDAGVPCHAHKRSTNSEGQSFRQAVDGSDFHCAFHWTGMDDPLYVFEAPIDLLSYITLNPKVWTRHNYVACCGTSAIPVLGMLERQPDLRTVYLCMDNDRAGLAASQRISELLQTKGLNTEILIPELKDWNEDLCAMQEMSQAPPMVQTHEPRLS